MNDQKNFRDVVVVGAGVVGVCTAWQLQKRGFKVIVVDKKKPAEETSWGNAGLIQRECVLPYAFPEDLMSRVRIAFNMRDNIRYDPAALLRYWYAVFEYWRYSRPANYDVVARQFATLVEHCTEEHEMLIKETKSQKLLRKGGFIELFRTKTPMEIEEFAEKSRSRGVIVDVLDQTDINKLEPYVNPEYFSGGVRFVDSWRVTDPGALVKAYADHFVSRGGTIVQAAVQGITPPSGEGNKWVVHTDCGDLEAPNVVVAAGPWSADLVKPLGYHIPLYPLRGYSAHFKTIGGATLNTSIVDVENGFAMGPMDQGMRITTGGELNLLSNPPQENILNTCVSLARQFFPLGDQVTETWYGHRPCISDMKPVIGESAKQPGLWMCFGHGHSGFTLGPVSGRLLAEIMNEEKPLVDPRPFDPDRF